MTACNYKAVVWDVQGPRTPASTVGLAARGATGRRFDLLSLGGWI